MKPLEEIKHSPKLVITATGVDGGAGMLFKFTGKAYGTVVWSNDCGWEHVSVSPLKKKVTPTWDEMCWIKDMFFYDDEVVVQYHPAKSEYVNNMPNCLHLWRCTDKEMPTPPSIMVGVKKGQTAEDLKEAIRDLYSKGEH